MPFKIKLLKAARNRLQRSIQTKLAIVLLLVGFTSLSSLGIISVWLGKQEVQNEVGKRNREVATLVSGQVESYVKSLASDLEFAARSLFEVANNFNQSNVDPGIVMRLLTQTSSQPYRKLAWIDKNGARRAFTSNPLSRQSEPTSPSLLDQFPLDMSHQEAFLTTQSGKTYYSKVTFVKGNSDPL